VLVLSALSLSAAGQGPPIPTRIPLKRSSQIQDGFGINTDLPRPPYLPWDQWWWTRMFDAGIKWARIGQYENSTDYTSWDWIERTRGEYSIAPEVEDYVNSLVENGVDIEMQLLYGNALYTSPAGRTPHIITPLPGSAHTPDRSIYSVFWPPKTADQILAFTNYVRWMVKHFRRRVRYYEIWNEPNDEFWNPKPNPEEYGRLFKAAIAAVHESDPEARIVFGGLGGTERTFTKRALDACQCGSGIDVFAYHVYPDYGHNMNPEAMEDQRHERESPRKLREMVRQYPGVRKDLIFWDDESNSIPSWVGSDESVQRKYIPRGMLYDRAAGLRTFVWCLAAGTDGNEGDDFGLIHGMMFRPNDFTPRPAFESMRNTIALFSDATLDSSIRIESGNNQEILSYGFRAPTGKAIIAYWLPVHSEPGDRFPVTQRRLVIRNSGIRNPVLIDISSGQISPLKWKAGTHDTLESVPVSDSVHAIADASYFDWPVLPETPSGLTGKRTNSGVELRWELHGGTPQYVVLDRRSGEGGNWERILKLPGTAISYNGSPPSRSGVTAYRVRAGNAAGISAYSNVVRNLETR
jgi:hypothetical protein